MGGESRIPIAGETGADVTDTGVLLPLPHNKCTIDVENCRMWFVTGDATLDADDCVRQEDVAEVSGVWADLSRSYGTGDDIEFEANQPDHTHVFVQSATGTTGHVRIRRRSRSPMGGRNRNKHEYTSLSSMVAELTAEAAQLEAATAGSAKGLSGTLFARHHAGTLQKKFLELEYRNGVLQLKAPTDLTRVTDSRVAIIGAGVDTASELNTGEHAAAPQGITEADATTGWSESGTSTGGVFESVADPATGFGTHALRATSGTVNADYGFERAFTVEDNEEYLISAWVKCVNPDAQSVEITGVDTPVSEAITTTAYRYYQWRVTADGTEITVAFVADDLGVDNDREIIADGISVLHIDDTSADVACNPDHTVVAGDACTVWDYSAGDTDETAKSVDSVDGRFITFDAALDETPQCDLDYLHAEGTCELGELRAGGNWAPSAGVQAWWSGGLFIRYRQGTGYLLLKTIGAKAAGIPTAFLSAHIFDTHEMSGAADSYFVSGPATDTEVTVRGLTSSSGTWKRCSGVGAFASPSRAPGSACGDPSNKTGICNFILNAKRDPVNAAYNVGTSGDDLTVGNFFVGNSASAAVSWLQDEDYTQTCFAGRAVTSGRTEVTIKKLHQVEVNV